MILKAVPPQEQLFKIKVEPVNSIIVLLFWHVQRNYSCSMPVALVFRAYYASLRNPRITSKGHQHQRPSLVYQYDPGTDQEPDPTPAVCFDTRANRTAYRFCRLQANRQETPEDILPAVPGYQTHRGRVEHSGDRTGWMRPMM